MPAVRWLALAAVSFAVSTLSFSATPEDVALDRALQGAWCDSDDAGVTCREYEEYKKGAVVGCGLMLETGDRYSLKMSYTVQGRRACGVVTASTVVSPPALGTQICKEVLGFNDDTMNYRLDGIQKIMTSYRVPHDPMTCLGAEK